MFKLENYTQEDVNQVANADTANHVKKEENDCFEDPLEHQERKQKFCSLCLRLCARDERSKIPSNCRTILGLSWKSKRQTACKTCRKMLEMIVDFRTACLEAEKWAETCSEKRKKGLDHDPEVDVWWLGEAGESIDQMHQGIKRHIERIERERLVEEEWVEDEQLIDPAEIKEEPENVEPFQENIATDFLEVINTVDSHESQNEIEDESMANTNLNAVQTHQCEKCLKYFDSKAGVSLHYQYCSGSDSILAKRRLHICSICSASFISTTDLSYHMNKHKGIKPFECRKKCGKSFTSKAFQYVHEGNCRVEALVCPICGQMLKNKNSLTCHLSGFHGEARFGCDRCDKKFRSKRQLVKHQSVHSDVRNYPCTMCDKSFKSPYAAKVHLRIHTQEKPFPCSFCEQAFAYKCLLKAHVERSH